MAEDRCTHPECGLEATHHPTLGGEPFEGFEHLCCLHVDVLMMESAQEAAAVMPDQAAGAIEGWRATHDAECGPVPGRWRQVHGAPGGMNRAARRAAARKGSAGR